MRTALALALLAVGCTSPLSPPGDDDDTGSPLVADANGCHGAATLDGAQSDNASFGPFAFGTGRFCLRLDASANTYAHFMAESSRVEGETSSLTFQLQRMDGTVLADGHELVIGQTSPIAFTTLELSVDGGTSADVLLLVDGDATSTVAVSLFERLE